MAPHKILVDDSEAHLIDWAWPTRGPAWIDPAAWIIHLIDAGHTPAQAEVWAAHLPSWRDARSAAVSAFADANAALWAELAAQDPGCTWKPRLARSARAWSRHRTDTDGG